MDTEEAIKKAATSRGIRNLEADVEPNSPSVATDEEDNEVANAGELCRVKTLFEGPPKCGCCINWVEEPPQDLRQSVEDEEEAIQHALLVRMMNNHGEGKPLKLHSIVVQSSPLRSVIGDLFQGYQGITSTLKKLVFKTPFHPFFYEWDRLNQLALEEQDPVRKGHIRLLKRVMKSELKTTISTCKDLDSNSVITFDYLWTIFKPGTDIYVSHDGHDCFYRLKQCSYQAGEGCVPSFQLTANQIDYDGKTFGYRIRCLCISDFQGTRPIEELDIIPASRLSSFEDMKKRATERGQSFRKTCLEEYHYAAYRGIALEGDNKRYIDGRIVVDALAYEIHNDSRLQLKALKPKSLEPGLDVSDQNHSDPAHPYRFGRSTYESPAELSDDLLYLCSPTLRGYDLKTKRWAMLYVDFMHAIKWNDTEFESLVLQRDYKRLIASFVESHVANKEAFDDIIEGKGQGIIILLEGPPGVGKTLTAEAVADNVKQPLYAISAGELGSTAEGVESKLTMVLDVAAKWGAVVLLDESDVFLERRSASNIDRNGRRRRLPAAARAVDPAFQSRIHVTIRYPPLDAAARRQIWKRFVCSSRPGAAVAEEDYDELMKLDVNGREIKNMVRTAQLLAGHEKTPLSIEHIRTIVRVTTRTRETGKN
ncbi:P-loop containing nucleoside triphosphate hydrolase protein [Hypoxylon sp. FL1284]|nr:P-loop containing nucleoside triphosphate hydrolase protein [Hypoxylon sp. FL1284]